MKGIILFILAIFLFLGFLLNILSIIKNFIGIFIVTKLTPLGIILIIICSIVFFYLLVDLKKKINYFCIFLIIMATAIAIEDKIILTLSDEQPLTEIFYGLFANYKRCHWSNDILWDLKIKIFNSVGMSLRELTPSEFVRLEQLKTPTFILDYAMELKAQREVAKMNWQNTGTLWGYSCRDLLQIIFFAAEVWHFYTISCELLTYFTGVPATPVLPAVPVTAVIPTAPAIVIPPEPGVVAPELERVWQLLNKLIHQTLELEKLYNNLNRNKNELSFYSYRASEGIKMLLAAIVERDLWNEARIGRFFLNPVEHFERNLRYVCQMLPHPYKRKMINTAPRNIPAESEEESIWQKIINLIMELIFGGSG